MTDRPKNDTGHVWADEVRRSLQAMAEPEYAAFSVRLVPHLTLPMLGVRIPKMRMLARRLAAEPGWRAVFDALLKPESFEEQMVCGLLPGYGCRDYEDFEAQMRRFLPVMDNWSVCDCCCCTYTIVQHHREEAWPFLTAFLRGTDEMMQRFGIVMLMTHYHAAAFLPMVLQAYTAVKPVGYYAEMALAWALSVFFLEVPQEVMALLQSEVWPPVVRRMACRKILESRRTPAVWSDAVRQLGKTIGKEQER